MTHNISIHTGAAQPRCPFSLLPIYSAGVAGEVTFAYICGMKRESFVRLMVRGAADFLLGLAWEPLCPVCGAVLGNAADVMCPRCMLELPRTMMWLSGPSGRFADVLANAVAPPGFAAAWFDYDPSAPSAELIRGAKYYDRPRLARRLGEMFAREVLCYPAAEGAFPFGGIEVLLPVPMHWRKQMSRGYNQSVEIARGISLATGMAVADNLVAVRRHATQTRKSRSERGRNLAGTVAVVRPHELDGRHIAVVDDILTTGATLAECVHAISVSGARPLSISLLTLGATV